MTDNGSQDEVPQFRVWTCGPLLVERWDGSAYHPVRTSEWAGSSYPRLLLKVLVCQRGRQVRRGEVLEHLWPEIDPEESGVCLNDAAYRLRTVLRPGKGEQSLLHTGENAGSYRLAGQDKLWIDADAALSLLEQAEAAEHKGDDPLPLVEEAAQYLVRGVFLAEEEELWAYGRRATLERARHGCVLWQARLYQQRKWLRKAERLLCQLLEENPTDEDALCILMTNLHQQRRTSEALHLFKHTAHLLREEGMEIMASTKKLAERLRTSVETSLPNQNEQNISHKGGHELAIRSNDHSRSLAPMETNALQLSRHFPVYQEQADVSHMLLEGDTSLEQQLGIWLGLGASSLSSLFDAGWSIEKVLDALQIVLQGVQDMPAISRRKLLQLGAAAMVSTIAIPAGKHVSEEERMQLVKALGESIGAGWKLFHKASPTQMLAIGRAQLYLTQQAHSSLYSEVRPLFYSAIYQLIGATSYFLGQFNEAQKAVDQSYIVSLQSADGWLIGQSLSWQAYLWESLGQYSHVLRTADEALRIISQRSDRESIRLRARLFAHSAECAAMIGDEKDMQIRLAASKELLEYIPGNHEEFDSNSWLQHAGTCALNTEHYDLAVRQLQQAIGGLPTEWTLRYLSTSLPLARAFAYLKELDETLAIAYKILPVITSIQSALLKQKFLHYVQSDLLANFPHEKRCHTLLTQARQQLALL
ncbi:MAG TPA: BTAD domain-containing putative transcriptional regulator [Ktedonobacteraceae bacterium]|nr:BTAD domain-containing putative transcriptional regulator [Ktedonobacteraceae bacterium]